LAVPNLYWSKEGNKNIPKYDDFQFIEINATDLRPQKDNNLIRIYENKGFERNLISLLQSARINTSKDYDNSTEEQSKYMRDSLSLMEREELVDFTENEVLKTEKPLYNLWTKILFFNSLDYDNENNL